MLKSILSCGLAALVLGAAALPAAAVTENLIVNGTFDDNTTGWIGTYKTRDGDPTIDTGSYFFPGPGPFHMIYQDYALTGDQLDSLATGDLSYTLSADLFGWHSQRDRGTLSVFFRDAADDRIGSATLTSSAIYDGWWDTEFDAGGKYFQSISGLLPTATTSLSFIISSTRIDGGTNNDGYIDNASFVLAEVAPVPLPAALPMLGGGVLALAGIARRKRGAARA